MQREIAVNCPLVFRRGDLPLLNENESREIVHHPGPSARALWPEFLLDPFQKLIFWGELSVRHVELVLGWLVERVGLTVLIEMVVRSI